MSAAAFNPSSSTTPFPEFSNAYFEASIAQASSDPHTSVSAPSASETETEAAVTAAANKTATSNSNTARKSTRRRSFSVASSASTLGPQLRSGTRAPHNSLQGPAVPSQRPQQEQSQAHIQGQRQEGQVLGMDGTVHLEHHEHVEEEQERPKCEKSKKSWPKKVKKWSAKLGFVKAIKRVFRRGK